MIEMHPEEHDIVSAQTEIKRLRAALAENAKGNLALAGLLREAGCARLDLKDAIAERDAEIARLRPLALDLTSVPAPWRFFRMDQDSTGRPEWRWTAFILKPTSGIARSVYGTGPTPAAALASAIERTK